MPGVRLGEGRAVEHDGASSHQYPDGGDEANSSLRHDFPAAAKAFGIFSFVASAGASVGLVAGGIPLGIATATLAHRMLPSSRGLGLVEGADVIAAGHDSGSQTIHHALAEHLPAEHDHTVSWPGRTPEAVFRSRLKAGPIAHPAPLDHRVHRDRIDRGIRGDSRNTVQMPEVRFSWPSGRGAWRLDRSWLEEQHARIDAPHTRR